MALIAQKDGNGRLCVELHGGAREGGLASLVSDTTIATLWNMVQTHMNEALEEREVVLRDVNKCPSVLDLLPWVNVVATVMDVQSVCGASPAGADDWKGLLLTLSPAAGPDVLTATLPGPSSSPQSASQGAHQRPRSLDVYLLAGQSNMAGRAVRRDVLHALKVDPWACIRGAQLFNHDTGDYTDDHHDLISCYDPTRRTWGQVHPCDVHVPVDTKKKPGLGPGSAFAAAMLSSASSSGAGTHVDDSASGCAAAAIGLVPSAVGSTSLTEWLPFTHSRSQPHPEAHMEPPGEPCPPPPLPASEKTCYHLPGGNLVECALRSLLYAMQAAPPHSTVRGILWYQGENDAATPSAKFGTEGEEDKGRYLDGFCRLYDILQLGVRAINRFHQATNIPSPQPTPTEIHAETAPVPMVTVAITAARPWLEGLGAIREQQLHVAARRQHRLPLMGVVDAFGLPLAADGIHLTASGSMQLGVAMAALMTRLQWQALLGENAAGVLVRPWVPMEAVAVGGTTRWNRHVALARCINDVSTHVKQAYENAMCSSPLVPVVTGTGDARRRIRDTGLKQVSFVHGSVDVLSILTLLDMALSTDVDSVKKGGVFVDLGCGEGSVVAAATVHESGFSEVRGVELLSGKLTTCREMVAELTAVLTVSWGIQLPRVRLIQSNFLEHNVSDADVVYACATCYAEDLMSGLLEQVRSLKRGARVILVDKWLSDAEMAGCGLRRVGGMQVKTTWGSAMVLVFEKE